MATPPPLTPDGLLDRALSGDPSRALLTFYDDATGERAELSVATLANWVAKTANLCRDGLGLDVGDRVAIALPCHWQAVVWWLACWRSGLVVVAPGGGDVPPEATVLAVPWPADAPGPEPAPRAGEVVALGLGPMGLPRPGGGAPPGAVDYDREIHAHGDRFVAPPGLTAETPALESGSAVLTAGALGERAASAAARWGLTPGDRLLTDQPFTQVDDVLPALLVPLLADVGAVLCRHLEAASDGLLARRVRDEQVTAVTRGTRLSLPGAHHLD